MTKEEYLKTCEEHFDKVPQDETVTCMVLVLCREKAYNTLYHGEIMLPHLIEVANSITDKTKRVVDRARKSKTNTVTFSS